MTELEPTSLAKGIWRGAGRASWKNHSCKATGKLCYFKIANLSYFVNSVQQMALGALPARTSCFSCALICFFFQYESHSSFSSCSVTHIFSMTGGRNL